MLRLVDSPMDNTIERLKTDADYRAKILTLVAIKYYEYFRHKTDKTREDCGQAAYEQALKSVQDFITVNTKPKA